MLRLPLLVFATSELQFPLQNKTVYHPISSFNLGLILNINGGQITLIFNSTKTYHSSSEVKSNRVKKNLIFPTFSIKPEAI